MDQLSSLYVRMASGAHSQLYNPTSVMNFVDQMQFRVEKSSAPRKNFLIDPSTPHSDVVIAESSALKPGVGWVTLQVTEGIRRGIHEWGIKIEHQGESNDESGLMLGIVPKNFSKYDTFISQGGGWCLSRAGKFYGHWRRTDTGGGALTFGTGDRVVLTLDYEGAVMTVRVGEKMVVGELSGLTMEVFPAVSLHYRHQHIRFDHHAIRETSLQQQPWLQRQSFPLASAYMPLSFHEVQSLPLNSYLFSNVFQSYASLEGSSAVTMEDDHTCFSAIGAGVKERGNESSALHVPSINFAVGSKQDDCEQRSMRLYMSAEASAARLTVLSRAFAAVRRYVAVLPGTSLFLAPHITAEYLRQRLYDVSREASVLHGGGGAFAAAASSSLFFGGSGFLPGGVNRNSIGGSSGWTGYDAALNCGAVIVVNLFIRAVSSGQEVATPLVISFRDLLLSLPIFSLAEGGNGSETGAGSALSPDTVQLAVDHIVRLLDTSAELSVNPAAANATTITTTVASTSATTATSTNPAHDKKNTKNTPVGLTVPAVTAALLEVAVLLALQRGLISEVLRVCRYLLRVPANTLSPSLVTWLQRHSARLLPRRPLPDVGHALKRACDDPASFTPTQVDPLITVLSVAYGTGSTLYVHTVEGLKKYGPSAATPYTLLADTRQPTTYCVGALRSSLAVTFTQVFLMTDRMATEEVALVLYSLQLEQQQVLRWADMHSSWPRHVRANPQLVTIPDNNLLLLYQRPTAGGALRVADSNTSSNNMNNRSEAASRSRSVRRSADAASSLVALPPPLSSSSFNPTGSTSSVSAESEVVIHAYSAADVATLTRAPLWTRTLRPPPIHTPSFCLDRCLLLRKPSLVDLGSPEAHLTVAGGHVTVELWAQFLDKEDANTLYQHGDRSTNGEVFLELIKWEGAHCIRGGYRHDVRGSCLVSAPLPPTAERQPMHIALMFDGRWRLFFEGEEVAGNRQGPHVSLDAPKQRWTVGAGCTCLLTGLRVWRLSRTSREMMRDYRRPLDGDEPGLVVQFFFDERSGNVVLNHVCPAKASSHAVCSGSFTHVSCSAHPWRNSGFSSQLQFCTSTSGTSSAFNNSGDTSPPACARLHEWRDLTSTTACVTRGTLLLSTPVHEGSPYPAKDGGRAILFFDVASGVAHRSLFFLTSRSPARHCMQADPTGRLWEMFEVDASLVKGEQESSYLLSLLNTTGATPQRSRERILAVVPLPLEEEESAERFCGLVEQEEDNDDVDALPNRSGSKASAGVGTVVAGSYETSSQLPSFADLMEQQNQQKQTQQTDAKVTYSTVALWLLRLLAAHADADPGPNQTLFTPLADDVSSRCVNEVRISLGEHFRVVKANNARRAVALRTAQSRIVVATALRVLLRLVRRARAFGLHPSPLGLTVIDEGVPTAASGVDCSVDDNSTQSIHEGNTRGAGDANACSSPSEVSMTLLLRELHTSSLRRRTGLSLLRARPTDAEPSPSTSTKASGSAITAKDFSTVGENAECSTLLGHLADVINDDGLTLPPSVVSLARTVTVEGVGLFLPDVRQRARLLRDLLHASSASASVTSTRSYGGLSGSSSSSAITTKASSAVSEVTEDGAVAVAEYRVPAMNVLLDAVTQSFTTVLAAAPLLSVENGVASLSDLCDTLRILLEESAVQWRRKWTSPSPSSFKSPPFRALSTISAAAGTGGTGTIACPSASFTSFAVSLSEAIASLQLLLLSACQGSRWEVALTQMHANGVNSGGGAANNSCTGGAAVGVGGGLVGGSNTSGEGISSGSSGGSVDPYGSRNGGIGINVGMASVRDPISVAALGLQHLCFSQAASYHPCVRIYYSALFANAESCLSLCVQTQQNAQKQLLINRADEHLSLSAMVASLSPTFLTAPLHTALSAIPLVLTVEDGQWFLAELDKLLRLTEALLGGVAASLSTTDNERSKGADAGDKGSEVVQDNQVSTSLTSFPAAAARSLLSSLRNSLSYASAWVAAFLFNCSTVSSASVKDVAVRQRLGLASVTATPTAQHTVTKLTATLDGAAAADKASLLSPSLCSLLEEEEEAAAVWEHPLLEGGIWPLDADAVSLLSAKKTTSEVSPDAPATAARGGKPQRRDTYVRALIQNSAYWSAKQAAFDPLAARTSAAITPLITLMAAAALHLSTLPLQTLPATEVERLMDDVMHQLSRPVRTELMSRRAGEAVERLEKKSEDSGALGTTSRLIAVTPASRQRAFEAVVQELQQRCELLLRVRTCTELWAVEDALFAIPTCDHAAPSVESSPHNSTKLKLRGAWHIYEQRHVRYRAHLASQPRCTLQEATQLVKRVILSPNMTSASLLAALRQRERLATVREAGIVHLLQLVQRAPCSAESVAQLLSAQGRGSQSHFEDGLRGCSCDTVVRIRRVMYELMRFSFSSPPATSGEQKREPSPPNHQDGTAAASLSLASSASILCGLLDRAWQPRELALFVQLRVVPTLMTRYVTLFAPMPEGDAHRNNGDGSRSDDNEKKGSGRRASHLNDTCANNKHSSTTTAGLRSATMVAGGSGVSGARSVELRPVALAERQHRDHVVAAQQARRTSKSALVSAVVLQRQSIVGDKANQRGSVPRSNNRHRSNGGGMEEEPLQYTACEAMQAKVWLTMKNLVLQATAMLTPWRLPSLSRVEQTAVMAFLADALRAIGGELQHCRDVLAGAVHGTPVLLAQAGDAAVLEPLVTVQDQVDVLCSLLSVVAGTLSSAQAPNLSHSEESKDHSKTSEGEALFLNTSLSTVCAGIAETLLELVFLDVYHAHAVREESGVGCVVRDAAACARIASLLLCRCQPTSVHRFSDAADTPKASPSPFIHYSTTRAAVPTWKDMYASPVFSAASLAAASPMDGGQACLQRWMDLSTYAMATTGLSGTTQHLLLAVRRLLHEPAWAAKLRSFAAAYKRLVLTYVKAIQESDAGEGKDGSQGGGNSAANAAQTFRVRELAAVRLYAWTTVLGGQLLVPPVNLGAQVSYLDDKNSFQPTLAYVVDLESVAASSSSLLGGASPPSPHTAPTSTGTGISNRRVRGSSHLLSKIAAAVAADGERVRHVVVVPTDASRSNSGYCRHSEEEVSLSPQQLFLPSWEDPIAVPPYSNLVEDFLLPAIQHCVPLLAAKIDAAATYTVTELSVFVSLLSLTSGIVRARPHLGCRLLKSGALQLVHQHGLQGMVRLPFPLKVLKEWAALVAVRAAEETAALIYSRVDETNDRVHTLLNTSAGVEATRVVLGQGEREGRPAFSGAGPVNPPASTATWSPSPTAVASPATNRTPLGFNNNANSNANANSNTAIGSSRSPPLASNGAGGQQAYTSLSAPSAPFHGSSEAMLDAFRSSGVSVSTPTFLPGGYVVGGGGGGSNGGAGVVAGPTVASLSSQLTAPTGLSHDIASDYGLLRLARSLGVFAGTYNSASMSAVLGSSGVGVGERNSPGVFTNTTTNKNNNISDGRGTPVPARIPPCMEISSVNGGAPMFLSFPMWDAHLHRGYKDEDHHNGSTGGSNPLSVDLTNAPPHTPAAVVITPSLPEVCFPVWDDGFAIETVVVLNDGDVYPAIGDALNIPCSWARVCPSDYEEDSLPPASPSPFEFPLVTLYAADPAAATVGTTDKLFPFIQIKVHRTCLSATVTLPNANNVSHRASETIVVVKPMRREDWHHCMHVSLMFSATCVTLSRNGETANAELRGDAGRRLEALLRNAGFIRAVVLGRTAKNYDVATGTAFERSGSNSTTSSVPVREMDGPMALLGGLRVWGTSALRTSVRVVAELVARDHALQPFGLPDHLCFFEMNEGNGGVIYSADTAQQYHGVLTGAVRWAIEPLPLGFYPSIELNASRPRSGVTTAPVSCTRLPRSAMLTLVQSLSPLHFARFGGDVLWSLLVFVARHTTVTALEVGMSPAYALLPLPAPPSCSTVRASNSAPVAAVPIPQLTESVLFDPRHVLDPRQKLPHQLLCLFELQDNGCLPNRYEQLLHCVVERLVRLMAADEENGKEETSEFQVAEGKTATKKRAVDTAAAAPTTSFQRSRNVLSPLTTFVADTALLLRQLRRDDGEAFVMELPPTPLSASVTAATSPSSSSFLQGTAVLPLAFTNGGTGVLSFDTKYRNMEQATLYKDEELKNVLAKYPDGQGVWPAYALTAAEAPWAYLRSVPSSAGHRMTMEAKANSLTSSILTVTIKSLKPAVLHAIVRGLCEALHTLAKGSQSASQQRHRDSDTNNSNRPNPLAIAHSAAERLLDARVIAALIQQSSARSSDDDCVHFVLILTEILQLWRSMPHTSPFDQLPLATAMSHLNLPLCSMTQHLSSDADLGSLVSATTGTYSPYVQALVSLWTTAIQVDCAWAGRSYLEQLQARWRRVLRTWQRAAVVRLATPIKTLTAVAAAPTGESTPFSMSPSTNELQRNTANVSSRQCTSPQQQQRKQQPYTPSSSCGTLTSAPCTVGLVALAPAAKLSSQSQRLQAGLPLTMSHQLNNTGSGAEKTEDGSQVLTSTTATATQKVSCPKGVTRKGNGLWIVNGSSGSGGETAEVRQSKTVVTSAITVRSTVGFTTGAVYWEVYVTNISRAEHPASQTNGATLASNVLVGVATEHYAPTFTVNGPDGAGVFLGSDTESWAFDGGRALRYYKGYSLESNPRTKWKVDDVIGFVLDISQNRLCCLHNGRLVSEFNGSFLSPQQRAAQVALFPVVICTGEGSCEVNFGAAGFSSTPPPGCMPVDPSLYVSEEASRVWQLVLAEEVVVQRRGTMPSGVKHKNSSSSVSMENDIGEEEEEEIIEEKSKPSRRPLLLSHPALLAICRRIALYTRGRCGPLDVMLLCSDGNAKTPSSRECKTEKEASLLLGSVVVTSGRWYFEVVLPGEPTFHIGWYAWKSLDEKGGALTNNNTNVSNIINNVTASTPMAALLNLPNGRPQLGHDEASWGLDASRMTARHNRHQTSLARRVWKCGDVVGCLLDCDAGTIVYTVNGEPLMEVPHGNSGAGGGGRSAAPTPPPQPSPSSSPPAASATATAAETFFPAGTHSDGRRSDDNYNDPAAKTQGSNGPQALFTGVSSRETGGLVPAIVLEPKTSLVCLWNEDELLYPPVDGNYRALGGTHVVRQALVEIVTQNETGTIPSSSNGEATLKVHKPKENASAACGTEKAIKRRCSSMTSVAGSTLAAARWCLDAAALRKLLYYASKVQELHPASLRSYTMPSLYAIAPLSTDASTQRPTDSSADYDLSEPNNANDEAPPQQQRQQRDLCSTSGLDLPQLPVHLAALLFFAHLSAFLYPFAHAASLPFTVEDAPLGSSWSMTVLHATLNRCRDFAPPWTGLRVLQTSLEATSGAGDAVRLNVNRRKALTVVRDPAASATRRLRDSLFGQVYQLLCTKAPGLFRTKKKMWAVAFYGEGADDVGGPYRECLTQMCAELMGPSLTLFLPSANMTNELGEVRDGFVINPVCAPPVELMMYRFLGRLMGGCMRGGEPLSLYLPSALWKYLVGEPADDTDMARVDEATLNAITYVERIAAAVADDKRNGKTLTNEETEKHNAELAELCPGGFSLLNDAGVVDELVPGGAEIAVTVRNVGLYVRLVREHKLYGSGAPQRHALQQGFHEVVPLCSVAGLKWYELEELVCGQCDYDPDTLLDAARFEGLEATDRRVQFLRDVLRGFTRHQRALFMRFVSGRERLPPGIHLKILPDDAPRGNAIPSMTTMTTATSTVANTTRMTPQPPPPQIGRDGDSNSGSLRTGSFLRRNTFQQSQSYSNNNGTNNGDNNTSQGPQPPSSPPQLGFTPPPSQAVSLSPRLARTLQPPVLQPRQLLSGQRSTPDISIITTTTASTQSAAASDLQPQQHSQQHQLSSPHEADCALCDDTRLPHASTCFYWLRLPRYSSATVMAEKLLFAIEQCVDIDADFRVHDTDVVEQEAGPSLARVNSDEDDLFEDFSHLR